PQGPRGPQGPQGPRGPLGPQVHEVWIFEVPTADCRPPTACNWRSPVLSTRRVKTMPNRRHFVRTLAGASAAMLATGGRAFGQTRREVSIGGRRVKVIDIHGHFIEPTELEVVRDTNLAGNISNNLNGPLVLGPARIRALDEWGIDVQALSHQGGWWYGADRDLARRIVAVQNDKLAAWC